MTTTFFRKSTFEEKRQSIKEALGVTEIRKNERYLGLPSLVGKKKKVSFYYIRRGCERNYKVRKKSYCLRLIEKIWSRLWFKLSQLLQWIVLRDNYSKPTCGMVRFHFANPCFKTLHFFHLRLVLLALRNPAFHLLLEKHILRQKQI